VFSILREFSDGKPALCFCSARDDVSRLASKLSSEYSTQNGESIFVKDIEHAQILLKASKQIQNGTLKKCIQAGVGFHNAALSIGDRGIVEKLFTEKRLPVVATTSTLAMGVNLPAYLVIIKGVHVYRHGNGYVPLDYSTILQMIGMHISWIFPVMMIVSTHLCDTFQEGLEDHNLIGKESLSSWQSQRYVYM